MAASPTIGGPLGSAALATLTEALPTGSAPVGPLGRSHRLLHKRDFDQVFARGRRSGGAHFQVIAAAAPGGQPRLGLAVARGAGNSPDRARLRRLLREAFRAVRSRLTQSADVVVSIKQPWPGAGLHEVAAELLLALRKMRLTP